MVNNYYSQSGEDYIASKILDPQIKSGIFVEVGCIDGKRFSNTLHFAEKGWKGLCIEAHNDYITLLKQNRPESKIIHCAVGESDEDNVTFYANSRGSLSTLDKSQEDRFKKDYKEFFTGFEKQKVSKRSLNTIFAENNITQIDLLSIDIEGYEIDALKGLDLSIYKPKLIILESDSKEHEIKIKELILKHDYKFLFRLKSNLFFLKNEIKFNDYDILNKKNIQLIYTKHPLDKEEKDSKLEFQLHLKKNEIFSKNLNRKNLFFRIWNKAKKRIA